MRLGEGRARLAAPAGESLNLAHWPTEGPESWVDEERQESWEKARGARACIHTHTHTHTLAEEGAG